MSWKLILGAFGWVASLLITGAAAWFIRDYAYTKVAESGLETRSEQAEVLHTGKAQELEQRDSRIRESARRVAEAHQDIDSPADPVLVAYLVSLRDLKH